MFPAATSCFVMCAVLSAARAFGGRSRRAVLTGPTAAGWRGSNPGARRHRLSGLCGRGGAWASSWLVVSLVVDSSHRERCDSCAVAGLDCLGHTVSFRGRPVWVSCIGERLCGRLERLPYGHRLLVSTCLRRVVVPCPPAFGVVFARLRSPRRI